MSKPDNIPQMLKEILDRGFSEQSGNYSTPAGMFSYINEESNEIITCPNRRLLVLEGLPGAGKTTLKNLFGNEPDYEVVDQILPNDPQDDKDLTVDYILNSDELKTSIFGKSQKSNVILDRYYVSTLAYNWSYDQIFKTNTYEKVLKWYKACLKERKLIKPFCTFFIKVPIEYAFMRKNRQPDKKATNPWIRRDFL